MARFGGGWDGLAGPTVRTPEVVDWRWMMPTLAEVARGIEALGLVDEPKAGWRPYVAGFAGSRSKPIGHYVTKERAIWEARRASKANPNALLGIRETSPDHFVVEIGGEL